MTTNVLRIVLASAALGGACLGCVSIDPRADIALSAQYVKDRTGHALGWPGDAAYGPGVVWDGRSPLTARQAIALALRNNPSIRAELTGIAAAHADTIQAGLLPNPILLAALGWGVGTYLNARGLQALSSLWLMPSRQRAARAQLRRSVLRVSDNAIALAARVEESHRRVVHYQTLLPVLEEQRKVLARAERAARDKLAAGMGTSLDVNRVGAQLLEVTADARAARGSLDVEKPKLLELLGRADGPAAWSAVPSPGRVGNLPDEQALTRLARGQRLDLLAASWLVQARKARVREARLRALPDFSLGAAVERVDPADDEEEVNTVGPAMRLELPIFDQSQARLAKARAQLEEAVMQARAAEQKVIREVRQARRTLRTAEDQVRAYRTGLVPLATRNARQTEAAFDAGIADVVDVLMTESDWAKVRLTLQQLELERDLALIELARAVGGRSLLENTPTP